ncbi:MAG: hypothetical protein M1816_004983, partial [Peltula sp. TS41687]
MVNIGTIKAAPPPPPPPPRTNELRALDFDNIYDCQPNLAATPTTSLAEEFLVWHYRYNLLN